MATQTPNYNLIKPDPNTDYYNIEVHNDNADIIDAALSPIADPDQVPSGLTGKIAQWVSWITNRIKAITGKTNWYDNPATTLEAAKAHADANAPHAGHETPDGAQAKANAAVTAHKNEADPHPAYALDTELDTLEGTVNSHLADNVTDVDGAHGLKIESGIFTPTLISSGGGVPEYAATTSGTYFKIGNLVHVQITIGLSSLGTLAAGNLSVSGLPFTIDGANVNDTATANIGRANNLNLPAGTIQINGRGSRTITKIDLFTQSITTASYLSLNHITATANLNLSMEYKTA